MPLWACGATPCGGSRPSDSFLSRSEGLVHAEGAPTRFMVASYLKDAGMAGPVSALAMTREVGVPSQGGRGDALFPHT